MDQEDQKINRAIALAYDEETDQAPIVVAKGQGYLADKIKEIAAQSGVPIQEDEVLSSYLMALELHQEIPPELYRVVAEILAFIYRMDKRYAG